MKNFLLRTSGAVVALALSGLAQAATITIVNADSPGEGFNDTTPVAPVGGNAGTTLGQQRLNVFQAAANQWGAVLNSAVPIRINAKFDPQTCDANGAILGSAGPISTAKGFTGTPPAPYNNTYFMIAEVNALAGSDLAPSADDISMTFNVSIDAGCLPGTDGWWYDTAGVLPIPDTRIALMPVVFHEIAHGLGFLTIMAQDGTYFGTGPDRQPDIWAHFLMDRNFSPSGTTWVNLTRAQRGTSGTDDPNLVWAGANVTSAALGYMNPTAAAIIHSPGGIAGTYEAQEASFGPLAPLGGLRGNVVAATDTGASTTDACEAITNGAQVAGNIALVDRGSCNFTVKAANAQAVGAIGVLVANNVATGLPGMGGADPSITIPSLGITQALGASIRANLGGGVEVSLGYNFASLAGMQGGYLRMYAPNPYESGSSRSHFTTAASPNLLMEPALNQDLFSETDMTVPLFRDIFWPINEAAVLNKAPFLNAASEFVVDLNVATPLTEVIFSDVDAGTDPMTLSFTVDRGTLDLAAGAGVALSGSGTASASITGARNVLLPYVVNGNVTYTTVLNDTADVPLTLTVSDNGNNGAGGALSDTANATIVVDATNTPPTISGPGNQTIAEDTNTGALGVTVGDAETEAGSLVLTGTSSNATLVPNGNIVFGGSGGSRTVTVTPAANQSGVATITLRVTDTGALFTETTFLVTVTAVDDPPVAVADSPAVAEDSGANTIDVLANDTDIDAGPKLVTLVGSATNGTTAIGGGGANVSYTPTGNYCGADSFSYTITGGSSATVSVTVTCVDDGPAVANDDSTTVAEDSGTTTIAVLGNDTADPDDGSLAVTAASAASNGATAFTASGVSYTPNANYCGSDSFTYTINGGDTATVSVTVTCVNDAPTAVGSIATQSATEAVLLSVATASAFNDVDGDTLSYTLDAGAPAWLSIDSGTGVVSGTPPIGAAPGPYSVTVTASDPALTSAAQTFSITVLPFDLFKDGFETVP
jgi:hypothetical protein